MAALEAEPEVSTTLLRQLNGGRRPEAHELAQATAKARGVLRSRTVAKLRATAVLEAAAAVRKGAGYVPAGLPDGRVLEFESVEPAPGYPEGTAVRVRPRGAPQNGDGDVVVVNPPTLVQDPSGTVDVGGVRHREDPLAALALAVQVAYGSRGR